MSEEKKEGLPPDWIQDTLSSLRKKLEQNEGWPEKADTLLVDLSRVARITSVDEADLQMLSLLVNEALAGEDITVRYPAFYQKLLANAELRQAFLDALAMLSGDEADESELLSEDLSQDLAFLQTAASPLPTIQQTRPNKWRAAWHILAERLNQKLFSPLQPGYRSSSLLEEDSLVLMRSDFTVGDRQYDVILEAIPPLDTPEQLQLTLLVTPLTDRPLPAMIARLQWGEDELTAVLDAHGRAHFPPIFLHTILDENRERILSDLRLNLEIA